MSADPQVTTRIALIGDATIAGHCLRRLRASGFEVVACLPGSLSFEPSDRFGRGGVISNAVIPDVRSLDTAFRALPSRPWALGRDGG